MHCVKLNFIDCMYVYKPSWMWAICTHHIISSLTVPGLVGCCIKVHISLKKNPQQNFLATGPHWCNLHEYTITWFVMPQVVPRHNWSPQTIYGKLCCCRWSPWTNYGCHRWSALPQVVPCRKPAHGGDKSWLVVAAVIDTGYRLKLIASGKLGKFKLFYKTIVIFNNE